jgi:predicted ATP-binding protein involved in virulence
MQIRSVKINGFRGLGLATLQLAPGFNLLVGINGAGKTSLLEAIRILLAKAVQETTPASPFKDVAITPSDITVGRDFSVIEMDFSIHDSIFQLTCLSNAISVATPHLMDSKTSAMWKSYPAYGVANGQIRAMCDWKARSEGKPVNVRK